MQEQVRFDKEATLHPSTCDFAFNARASLALERALGIPTSTQNSLAALSTEIPVPQATKIRFRALAVKRMAVCEIGKVHRYP